MHRGAHFIFLVYVFLYVILKESVRVSSVCLCVACSSSFSLLLLSSLSGVKWLKNDLKTSPPKVFFFGRFFEFFNKQRHFVIFSPVSTHAREQHTQTFREEEREKERSGRESSSSRWFLWWYWSRSDTFCGLLLSAVFLRYKIEE